MEGEANRRLLGTLLNEMDGVGHRGQVGNDEGGHQGLIFVCCTNRLDAIDAAVIRYGTSDFLNGCYSIQIPIGSFGLHLCQCY